MARAYAPQFSGLEIGLACFVACAAQLTFAALLSQSDRHPLNADISDDNSKPMAVAITPVVSDLPLLKLGGKPKPGQLPDMWKKKAKPTPVKTKQNEIENAVTPSTKAEKTVDAIPDAGLTEAGVTPTDAETVAQVDPNMTDAVASDAPDPNLNTPGSAAGTENGTEADPLKAQVVDQYRAQLTAWFTARFPIRGKLPFDVLKELYGRVVAHITADRKVGSYEIAKASGNEIFDGELRKAMDAIVASGAVLPPPPPAYPDILGATFPVGFRCNIKQYCE
ncbi:MAG: hypothetical protein NVSMB47_15850 [Polyangiales bacterium]